MPRLLLTTLKTCVSLPCGDAPTFFCLTAVGVVAICASVFVSTLPSRLIVAGLELDPRPSAVPGDIGASAKAVPAVLLRPLADVWLPYSWLTERQGTRGKVGETSLLVWSMVNEGAGVASRLSAPD